MSNGHWAARRVPLNTVITAETLEKCLDRVAEIIVQAGEKGAVYLPIYERLESELEKARAIEARMERVRTRAKR
jgi:hypothetical protein